MKKIVTIVCAVIIALAAQAQTTGGKSGGMTDEEVLAFVIKEDSNETDAERCRYSPDAPCEGEISRTGLVR